MNVMTEPDPDDLVAPTPELSTLQTYEPDPDDEELQRINGAMTAVCNRLQKALEMLKSEVGPMQSTSILQTLLKIIRNVIEHPEMEKYKRLRKTNPVIERNILNNKAALEILSLVGFREDVIYDNLGKEDAYLVLKRNDPGLLWLAKSTLESSRA
ncbi:ubiquitin and WLM domain-containing protein [Trifolium medium]|uniref:Ubiquitin and WLM domain-containing protein n=1 Tax=Trifolium medium TaxID=97028 RepID=A0A392N5X8_9FABA|nr:ubiquitin and WLM domain-containing protein [Trifolium medium]